MLFLYTILVPYLVYPVYCSPIGPQPKPTTITQPLLLNASWTGWRNIQNLFVFGDSYTSTGFDPNGAQPSRSNPIGNPAYPGDTTIGSSDWIHYLATLYNSRFIRLFDFAARGGTIDDQIDPSPYGALSFRQQVNEQFAPKYRNGRGGWSAKDSLFAVWFGVNDVMQVNAKANASDYIDALTESYIGSVETLHNSGARNFLFLNVPAVDRIPAPNPNTPSTNFTIGGKTVSLSLNYTPAERNHLKQYISRFNVAMRGMTRIFQQLYPDSTVWLFDTNTLFNRVLDDPASYDISSVIRNTSGYCDAYAYSRDTKLFRPECGVSRDQYFWADGLHPTSTVHELVAEQVVKALDSAPSNNGTVATA